MMSTSVSKLLSEMGKQDRMSLSLHPQYLLQDFTLLVGQTENEYCHGWPPKQTVKTELPPSSSSRKIPSALVPVSPSLSTWLQSDHLCPVALLFITSVLWPYPPPICSVSYFRTTFSEACTETPCPTESHHFHNGLFICSSWDSDDRNG